MDGWTVSEIVAVVSAVGSLVFFLISTLLTREAKRIHDDFKSLKQDLEDVKTSFGILAREFTDFKEEATSSGQVARRKLWEEIRAIERMLTTQEKECRGLYIPRLEYERAEKLKDRLLQAWVEQNQNVEKNLREVMNLIQKNLKRRTTREM